MKRIDNFTLETKILPSRAARLAPFSSPSKMVLAAGNVGPIYRFEVFTIAAWREKDKNEPRSGFQS